MTEDEDLFAKQALRNERLKPGDVVQHFKRELMTDKSDSLKYLYVIKTIAMHTETGEKLVVYEALDKNTEDDPLYQK